MSIDFTSDPHRRFNILTGEWILVSPHRTKRPWQGKVEEFKVGKRPAFDPDCYLCPGNRRAGGAITEEYDNTFVFDNDFGALLSGSSEDLYQEGLLLAKGERGICRVICFSPDHSMTLAELAIDDIKKVVDLWQQEHSSLGSIDYINYVQIFENKGSIMGCSNPHPHGQIWAQNSIPRTVAQKTKFQLEFWNNHQRSLLLDYLLQELDAKVRIIQENDHFVSLVPFWAVWPYETMIIPKIHMQNIGQLGDQEKYSFASILKDLTQRYDKLFDTSFPYSSGIHQSPTDGKEHKEWHFHMSFYPPLLRSATVKKFMVGYEMFCEPQRDISAESAAKTLRSIMLRS